LPQAHSNGQPLKTLAKTNPVNDRKLNLNINLKSGVKQYLFENFLKTYYSKDISM
jgi:hypothetical protein